MDNWVHCVEGVVFVTFWRQEHGKPLHVIWLVPVGKVVHHVTVISYKMKTPKKES